MELVSRAGLITYSSELLECQTSSWPWIRKWLLEQHWHVCSIKRIFSQSRLTVWGREILQSYLFHANNVAVFTAKNCYPEDHVTYCFSAARCARQVRQQSSKQFPLIAFVPESSFSVQKEEVLCSVSSRHFFKAIGDVSFLVYNTARIMRNIIWTH